MSKIKRQCSTCEHYGAPRGKRLYHASAYACRWKMPEIAWPASVVESYDGPPRAHPRHMSPAEGKTCPQWTAQVPK